MILEQTRLNNYTITLATCLVTNIYEVKIGRKTYTTTDNEKGARESYEDYKKMVAAL